MNLVESWGTGIPRLLREMKEYGLSEPEFADMEIALRINLYRVADTVQSSAELAPESAFKVHSSSFRIGYEDVYFVALTARKAEEANLVYLQ